MQIFPFKDHFPTMAEGKRGPGIIMTSGLQGASGACLPDRLGGGI